MRALLTRLAKKHPDDESGMAAVEFALLLPVLITLFFGVVELSLALACRADVANVASTAADLVAQESSVASGDMTNVFSAASAILYPYSQGNATITIYSIVDNKTSAGRVAWSCTKAGTATATTGPNTPPSGTNGGDMIAATNLDANGNPSYGGGGSVILATITYNYTSPTTKILSTPIAMSNTFYSKPRRVLTITGPTSCAS
jgi:Flp pilus assembly protein TadG